MRGKLGLRSRVRITNSALLLHFDGANGSTTFADSSGNDLAVTAYGDSQISTAKSKFGGSSGYFDGDGDYLRVAGSDAFDLSDGDRTIEFWLWTAGAGGAQGIVGCIEDFDVGLANSWTLECSTAPDEFSLFGDIGNGGPDLIMSTTIPLESWTHIALVSHAGTVKWFVDGVLEASEPNNLVSTNNGDLYVGTDVYDPATRSLECYIDELRVSRGVAVYTANFTPPTGPFGD